MFISLFYPCVLFPPLCILLFKLITNHLPSSIHIPNCILFLILPCPLLSVLDWLLSVCYSRGSCVSCSVDHCSSCPILLSQLLRTISDHITSKLQQTIMLHLLPQLHLGSLCLLFIGWLSVIMETLVGESFPWYISPSCIVLMYMWPEFIGNYLQHLADTSTISHDSHTTWYSYNVVLLAISLYMIIVA